MTADPPTSGSNSGQTDSRSCDGWRNDSCQGTPYCPARCPRSFDATGAPVLVKPLDEVETDSLVDMYETVESTTMGLPPDARSEIEQWLSHLGETGWNLVALQDDRIVGHIAVVPADAPNPKFVVFVRDEYHDRGIGTELVKQVIAHATDRGHEALKLSITSENRRAIAVYTNVGFEIVRREDIDLRMRLPLDEPITEEVQRPPAERSSSG